MLGYSIRVENMRKGMIRKGILCNADIEEICKLESEYENECDKLAEYYEEQGYPSHGENWELACENIRKEFDDEIDLIWAKYEVE